MTPDMMASISDNLLPSVGSILPKVDSLLSSLNTLVSDPALLKSVQRLDGITNDLSQATNGLSAVMKRDVPRLMGSTGRTAANLDHKKSWRIVVTAQATSNRSYR